MQITSGQCRGARGLLGWSQEQLATNANVSRATIADFELNVRNPMKNNLFSIEDSMFAAGVEFLEEAGRAGVGVRFREQKLEYTKNLRIDRFNRRATMHMRFASKPLTCVIELNAIDDLCHANFSTDEEFGKAISENLHRILSATERAAQQGVTDGRVLVTIEMLDSTTR